MQMDLLGRGKRRLSMRKELLAAVSALLLAATGANADTWTFNNPAGDLGTYTHDYVSNGLTITATGYTLSSGVYVHTNLYGKVSGDPSENGLGLTKNSSDFEITSSDFIQLDMSNILALKPFNVTIASVQTGEGFVVYGSNTDGAVVKDASHQLGSGSGTASAIETISIADLANYKYLDVTASSADVLLTSVSVTSPVPEPSSLAILAIGAVGLAGYRWRRRAV
jgi:hypothetical protein